MMQLSGVIKTLTKALVIVNTGIITSSAKGKTLVTLILVIRKFFRQAKIDSVYYVPLSPDA